MNLDNFADKAAPRAKRKARTVAKAPAKKVQPKTARPAKTFTMREIDSWVIAGRRYNP